MYKNISVIIPCYNESKTIERVLQNIKKQLNKTKLSYEILVIDNNSTDNSEIIAKKNAIVKKSYAFTVAKVRNEGVKYSKGYLLIFIDADIVVTDNWGDNILQVYQEILNNDNIITGSHPSVPHINNPLLYSWYDSISKDFRNTHIGTGHLIVSKSTFYRIGEFNDKLTSGEDYEFCNKAKRKGVKIFQNYKLGVIHLGYPNTFKDFIKREIWHGEGDFQDIMLFLKSKAATVGLFFLFLNILMLISLIFKPHFSLYLLTTNIFIATIINFYKFKFISIDYFFKNTIVSYIYLLCRGISLLTYYKK